VCVLPLQNDTVIGGALVSPARRWHVAGYRVDGAALSLVLMMVVAPAMGARHEAPLQDTLKSTGVAFLLWRQPFFICGACVFRGQMPFNGTVCCFSQ